MPKIMFLSYYFPPCGAGWVMRIINFIRHLPRWGWKGVVLTAKEEYYKDNATSDNSLAEDLPADLLVVRTGSLEPKIKLKKVEPKEELIPGIARPPLLTRLIIWLEKTVFFPDVKILWAPIALLRGKKIIESEGVDLIFVSVPDFSLLLIAYWLKCLTACPLVLDLRDDWAENPYYRQPHWYGRKLVTYWERKIVAAAEKVILVTERSREGFCRRYPQEPPDKFFFLPNGYDPVIEKIMAVKPTIPTDVFTIIHSGMIPPERVTPALFEAFKELGEEQPHLKTKIKLIFLGNVCRYLRQLVKEMQLSRQVEFRGTLPYEENIYQIAQAGLLLLIPSLNIPNSIPGKVYEYLAVRRPFLALSEDNVTRDFLNNLNYKYVYYPNDKQGIKEAIFYFYQQFCKGKLNDWPALPDIKNYNRAQQSKQLAQILDGVVRKNNA